MFNNFNKLTCKYPLVSGIKVYDQNIKILFSDLRLMDRELYKPASNFHPYMVHNILQVCTFCLQTSACLMPKHLKHIA